jgi:hypothetical protein
MKTTKLILLIACLISIPSFSQCWKSVSVGYANVLAIAENGTLWGWGKNSNGELGDGTILLKNTPVQIGTASNWKEISASIDGIYSFTLGIRTDGTLWAWGSNHRGQLGDGTEIPRSSPVQIGTDTDWKTVTAGLSHSVAIKENGTLWGWGASDRFALSVPSGPNVLIPRQIGTDNNWRQASAHDRVTVAVKTNNTVWAWGWNKNDFLDMPGGATNSDEFQFPTQKRAGINIRKTGTGDRSSMDINTSNYINGLTPPIFYIWDADNGHRTTGLIRLSDRTLWYSGVTLGGSSPVGVGGRVQLGTATNWSSVSVGSQCAAAINVDKEIWTWGSNFHGGLGIGTNGVGMTAFVPVQVVCPSALLSTPENDLKMGLHLYPNPAQDFITIESDFSIDYLVITDVRGKEISKQSYDNTRIIYDVSTFSKGMYFVKAYSENRQNQIKFIKN